MTQCEAKIESKGERCPKVANTILNGMNLCGQHGKVNKVKHWKES